MKTATRLNVEDSWSNKCSSAATIEVEDETVQRSTPRHISANRDVAAGESLAQTEVEAEETDEAECLSSGSAACVSTDGGVEV